MANRPWCAGSIEASLLSDAEFWEWMFSRSLETYSDTPEPDLESEPLVSPYPTPCSECGEFGPCGYDSLGRPMYHRHREDDDE